MMKRQIFFYWIPALMCWNPLGAKPVDDKVFADLIQPVFQQSCVKCHGRDGKVKGKVNLLKLEGVKELVSDLERLESIIDVLDEHEMPPEKEPDLKPEIRNQLVMELRRMLNTGAASGKGYAPTPIRRMNRFQYNNAVMDLLKLKVVVFPLPE